MANTTDNTNESSEAKYIPSFFSVLFSLDALIIFGITAAFGGFLAAAIVTPIITLIAWGINNASVEKQELDARERRIARMERDAASLRKASRPRRFGIRENG